MHATTGVRCVWHADTGFGDCDQARHCARPAAAPPAVSRDDRPTAPGHGRVSAKNHPWAILGVLLVLLGAACSVIAAGIVAQNAADSSRKAFDASSALIAATLQLAIQHEQDLVVEADAFFVRDPDATQSQFLSWSSSIAAFARYPELQGMSELQLVPAAGLPSFAARMEVNPPGPLSAKGTYQVSPPGYRAYYCLVAVSQSRYPKLILPAGIDYCSTSVGAQFLRARDSGQSMYIPYRTGKTEELALGTAIYKGGTVPHTVLARRAALIGWTGIEILPGTLLATALAHHPDTAVSFHYGAGTSDVTFKAGSAPANSGSHTIDLHNGWTVETFGTTKTGGIFDNAYALAFMFIGIALSILLSAFVYLLGSGRARARQKLEQRTSELRFQALHDPLTGLPNRTLILDRTDQLLARSRRTGISIAAMFIDMDDFKEINDTLGHSAGDEFLVAIAARLRAALRDGDTVGRFGGDEFVLLVEGTDLHAGAEAVAARVLEILSPPVEIAGYDLPLPVSASIGVATGLRPTPDDLLRDADIALYRAKGAGKGRAILFAPSMQTEARDGRLLALDIRGALDANEFFLLYQPTVDLNTNAVTGVEALLRWRHPSRGVVGPNEFIPAMESSGLILPAGAWVLEEACRQGALWHERGYPLTVSVNVSAKQLETPRIVEDVQFALSASGLDPSMLIVELTETVLMNDTEVTMARLGQLKALGVRLAIDDFGTGYSSLSYLRKFPIDVLKIDRSFISGLADTAEAAAIVHTLVQLGKILHLETIAEGIEDDEQRLRLQAARVDVGQGFLFSRPIDVEAMDRFLTRAGNGCRHTRRVHCHELPST
jgi:diguanylate cyclase (GGDEF)-like protein